MKRQLTVIILALAMLTTFFSGCAAKHLERSPKSSRFMC